MDDEYTGYDILLTSRRGSHVITVPVKLCDKQDMRDMGFVVLTKEPFWKVVNYKGRGRIIKQPLRGWEIIEQAFIRWHAGDKFFKDMAVKS